MIQKKFKIGTVLALIDHSSIIALAVILFIAFNSYSLILAVVWTISRITEGLIDFYNEKNYWGLLNIARQYSGSSSVEKSALSDLARGILKTKKICFSICSDLFHHWHALILNFVCYVWSRTRNYWMVWNCC